MADSEKTGTYGLDLTKCGSWQGGVSDPDGIKYNSFTFEGVSVEYNSQEAVPLRAPSVSWWSTIVGWFK